MLWQLLESAKGVLNAPEIATSTDRMIGFGTFLLKTIRLI